MKNYLIIFITLINLLSFSAIYSQTHDINKLNQLSEEFEAKWKLAEQRVFEYCSANDVPMTFTNENGVFFQMVDVIDGKPEYYQTDNYGAAMTTRANQLWEGGNTGLELTGDGYYQLGEWDAGAVLTSHQEFTDQGNSRVIMQDGASATHYHATHVAGTMVAAGIVSEAKGMGYGGFLKAWNWSNDEAEMAAAAASGLEISNHSYGAARGWRHNNGNWSWMGTTSVSPDEDYKFGFYTWDSRGWDQMAYNAPNYLIVKSAGNDRGEGPSNAGNGQPEVDGGEDGYDCIGDVGIAKNILTVGAVTQVTNYTGPESVTMSDFSCWGPADDGRIKPDIVGKGVDVYSTSDGGNTSYTSLQGTSMSAPNVAGSMALLQNHYQNIFSTPMRASTLKGLVLHTADEAGDHPGPDYMFGWGLMNAERAAQLITDAEGQNVIDEVVLPNGDDFSREVNVPGGDFRVTICWTDLAGSPVAPELNPRDPMIVNDLDLKITDENNNTYYPYKLDPENPSAAATTDGKNYVDNVEMIFIEDAPEGTYTISVDHDGTLAGGGQVFSIIISGIDEYQVAPQCSDLMLTPEDGGIDAFINQTVSWRTAPFATSYDVYFGTDGGGTTTPTNVFNGENFAVNEFATLLEPNTTYYVQIVPRNGVGTADNCDDIWSFTTMNVVSSFPFVMDAESVMVPELPDLWQGQSFSDASWQSTNLSAHSGSQAMVCYLNTGFVKLDYDNWFVSPPLAVQAGNEYNVQFFYGPLIPGSTESMSLYWGSTPFISDMTNMLYTDEAFAGGWEEANARIIPDDDGNVYLGFHVTSQQGYGVVLDDVTFADWGTVGVNNIDETDVRVIAVNSSIDIYSDESLINSRVMIYNVVGQQVYSGIITGNKTSINNTLDNGIYIVSLIKDGTSINRKVIVR
jgi:subtilisin family serine protease